MKNKSKKKNNERQKLLITIIIVIVTIVLISGGTYSWFMWQSDSADDTLVDITIGGRGDDKTKGESQLIISGTNVTNANTNNSTAPGIQPIQNSNCATSKYTLIGEATVSASNGTGTDMRVTPRLDLSLTPVSGRTLSTADKSHLHWALVDVTNTTTKTCVNPDYQGTFDKIAAVTVTQNNVYQDVTVNGGTTLSALGSSATMNITNVSGSSITDTLTFIATKHETTSKTYRVYVWLDSDYTFTNIGDDVTDPMQDLVIHVKWSNKSSMIQE